MKDLQDLLYGLEKTALIKRWETVGDAELKILDRMDRIKNKGERLDWDGLDM